ncbi:MAG: hypothetical protein FJ387_22460 [Verrucomicrobia bacterium]|nr:hypothetical protein [Verrucomicrobiota bacterium]
MQTCVLLSIRPEFAELIFKGLKKYEFRRVVFRSECVSRIVVYASRPVQRVIGEFEVAGILALGKSELWERTKRHAGIPEHSFYSYFDGREMAYAIRVRKPRLYETPLKLDNAFGVNRPPQSFRYIGCTP